LLTNYVYKLKPNVTQSSEMTRWVDMLRSHYNWCLGDRIAQYYQQFIQGDYCDIRTKSSACPITCFVSFIGATGEPWKEDKEFEEFSKSIQGEYCIIPIDIKNPRRSAGDIQITALPQLKKARPWYADIDSTVLQQNLKRLDTAYDNFFSGRGFPKFKNRSNFTSFTYQMGVKVDKNKIYLPKLGWMSFYNSRPIPTGFVIKAVTVRKRQDGWYVSIRIEDKKVPDYIPKPLTEFEKVIGCDLGITKLVHLSDGYQIENPRFATNRDTKRTLKIRQRRVSRKDKNSNNRKKANKKVGNFHKKITDKRQAYQWKCANIIVSRQVDAIALEDLNISGILRRCKVKVDEKTGRFLANGQSRKKGLNRAISDAAWNDLVLKIDYLAAKRGKIVIKVNPKYSSQECRNCGHIEKENRHKEKFICVQCGHLEHSDIGASKTIRDRAIQLINYKKVHGDSVEPESKDSKRPKQRKEKSPRLRGKRGEPGNPKSKATPETGIQEDID
jgi:putative transposase